MLEGHVTCICITYNRIELLREAIYYFNYQSHKKKDLIVLYQSNDEVTIDYIRENTQLGVSKIVFNSPFEYELVAHKKTDSSVLFIEVPFDQGISLGVKRNIGVEFAKGEYVCMWDDDDWYPQHRIEHQLNFIRYSKKKACTLASILLHEKASGLFYLTGVRPEGWEGTLLCERAVMGKYDDLNKREDTPVIHDLQRKNYLGIMEEPDLYVYNAHLNNVSGNSHFELIVKYAIPAETVDYPLYHTYLQESSSNN